MSNVTAIKPTPVTETWLSPDEVCKLVPGMTTRKLQRYRDEGLGPRYSKVGMTIVYAEVDVHAWLRQHTVSTREQS